MSLITSGIHDSEDESEMEQGCICSPAIAKKFSFEEWLWDVILWNPCIHECLRKEEDPLWEYEMDK